MSSMNSNFEGKRCPSCARTVYKVEEILCSGCPWHKECFKCGGTGDLGCQRKLNLLDFTPHFGVPYCKACYIRMIHKPAHLTAEKEQQAAIASSGSHSTNPNRSGSGSGGGCERTENQNGSGKAPERPASFIAPSRSSSITGNPLGANKLACPKCTKTVYKAEEIQLAGFSWHKSCFTCGGASETDGCKKTLNAQDFHPHRGIPFCKGCIGKQPIVDKRRNDSFISRTDTESSDTTAHDAAAEAAEAARAAKAADARGSVSTTSESIASPGPGRIMSRDVSKSEGTKFSPGAADTPRVDTTFSAGSGGTAASTAPDTPSGSAMSPAAAAMSRGDVEDSEDNDDDVETTYQDENGVPCTKTGEPLPGSKVDPNSLTPGGSTSLYFFFPLLFHHVLILILCLCNVLQLCVCKCASD
jgi:LIM domain